MGLVIITITTATAVEATTATARHTLGSSYSQPYFLTSPIHKPTPSLLVQDLNLNKMSTTKLKKHISDLLIYTLTYNHISSTG